MLYPTTITCVAESLGLIVWLFVDLFCSQGITEYSVVCVLFILPLLNHFLWLAFDHPLMNTETWLKDKKVLRRDRRLWCDAMMSVGLDLLPLAVLLFLLNCYSAIYKGSMVAGSEPFQTSTAWLWLQVIFLLDAINSLLKVWYKDSMTLLQSKMSILMLLLIVSLFAIGVQHVVLYLSLVVLVGSVLSWAAHSFHVRQTCQLQTYIDLHRNKEDNTFSKSLQVKTSWIQRISNFSLLCLAMMLSPCGISYIAFLFNDHSHSLMTSLLEDYYQVQLSFCFALPLNQ